MADLIATNWDAIRRRLERSTITEFDPQIVLKGPGRAVTGVNFDGVARRRAEILGSYGRYVKTDVARFYPSIYTHAIPWAILGKEHVKGHHHDAAFKKSFANLLDKAVGAGQEGQTIGIPIGPDTSRILSELVAVEVETIARGHIPDLNERAVRYVDDMLIGLRDTETPSAVLSGLSVALYEYELELNAEKTVTLGFGCPHAPEWIHYVRTFNLGAKPERQREDLDSFFEQAFHLADANPRENVLLFAAKRAASFDVHTTNTAHLVRWLLYSARRSPSCLSFVAEHLAATQATVGMPKGEIEAYILQQLPLKADAGHTDEVAWLLFWAREISLTLPAATLAKVTSLRSSVVAMLVLDLLQRGRVQGQLDVAAWQRAASVDGLRSELWLVAYEATKKGWWPAAQQTDFLTGHEFFADIYAADVEFYDPTKTARKKVKPTFLQGVPSASMLAGYPD
ncbi:RNA-directed DNA polymerase [Sphingomonas pseudosanguinis]|uniref:RNA-directed DNA polymerase n=1 Tax=Sphingomonas pseudosanguinis TaxID=413712 RepID=UPI003F844326